MAYNFEKVSVLVVDDNQPMLELIKSVLQVYGFKIIRTSRNGDEAFRIFCNEKPDLVITDWMMTPIDGISLTRRIRNDPLSPDQFTPVILMTGFSQMRRVMEARDAGVTEFLVKPFNTRDLYRRLSQIIERPRQFVRAEDFFGPDRRRKGADDYQGTRRREEDSVKMTTPNTGPLFYLDAKTETDSH